MNAAPARPGGKSALTLEQKKSLLDEVLDNTSERHVVIRDALDDRIDQIEEVLPDKMKGQGKRLVKRAMMTFARDPKMAECSAANFVRCVIEAAEIGLAIDGKLCHVVRYKSTWQCQPDYKGLIAVAKRSGQIKDIYGDVVCRNDHYRAFRKNDESELTHEYELGQERGDVVGAYAVVILPDDGWRYEQMDRAELDRIQRRAPAQNGPWKSDTDEMRKKTVFRRALKLYCDDPGVIRTLELMDQEFEEDTETSAPSGPPIGRQRIRSRSSGALTENGEATGGAQHEQEPADHSGEGSSNGKSEVEQAADKLIQSGEPENPKAESPADASTAPSAQRVTKPKKKGDPDTTTRQRSEIAALFVNLGYSEHDVDEYLFNYDCRKINDLTWEQANMIEKDLKDKLSRSGEQPKQ